MSHYKQYGDLGRTAKSRKKIKRKPKDQEEEPVNETTKKVERKKRNYAYVDTIGEQIKYLRRFKSMAGKKIETKRLYSFIKTLQKAIHERRIRKADRYASEIDSVQRIAVNAYQRTTGKYVEIKVPGELLERVSEIGKSEKVRPSVSFLKRFVGLIGKSYAEVGQRMKKLNENLGFLFERKMITQGDPYIGKVKQAQAALEKAIQQRSRISVASATLSGLNGIIAAEETESQTRTDLAGLDFCEGDEHPAQEKNKIVAKTAEEIANTHYETLPFGGYYQSLLKNPGRDFWMVVYGLPFQGKTTFSIGFAKYLAENFGNVLYITSEQWESAGLQQIINQVKASYLTYALTFSPSLAQAPPVKHFDFIFIDSTNAASMKFEEMMWLREKYRGKAFVTILQSTKAGDLRGDQRWRHSPGIVVKIHEQKAVVEKNQYFSGKQVVLPLPKLETEKNPPVTLYGFSKDKQE